MPVEINSWLAEVAQYLGSMNEGVYGNTPTANIFIQGLPNSPTVAIGIFGRGGPNVAAGVDPMTRLSLQLLVRRTTEMDGLVYAGRVFNLLNDKWNITPSFNGRIVGDHRPGPFFYQAKNVSVYTLNFTATLGVK